MNAPQTIQDTAFKNIVITCVLSQNGLGCRKHLLPGHTIKIYWSFQLVSYLTRLESPLDPMLNSQQSDFFEPVI